MHMAPGSILDLHASWSIEKVTAFVSIPGYRVLPNNCKECERQHNEIMRGMFCFQCKGNGYIMKTMVFTLLNTFIVAMSTALTTNITINHNIHALLREYLHVNKYEMCIGKPDFNCVPVRICSFLVYRYFNINICKHFSSDICSRKWRCIFFNRAINLQA